jgi:CrcB protein
VAETSFSMAAAVASGGALGALGRYLAISWFGHRLGTGFPYGTLAVNAGGSLLLGAFAALGASHWPVAPEVQAFVAIGVLGAFTTVSTFALDTAYLAGRHQRLLAGTYVILSVALSLAGAALGYYLVQAALA